MKYTKLFKNLFSLFYIGLFFIGAASAQNANDSSKNIFTASVNYQSRLHYFGRTDSLKSSGVFPVIGFKSKLGLYVNSSFIFIQNKATALHYTGTILEGGYRFPDNKTITGNLYYDQFLYQPNTILEQAAVKSQTGINLTYNNKFVNVSLNGDIKFSPQQTDFGLSAGIDKMMLFRNLIQGVVLALDPSFYMNGGTQKYTSTFKQSGIFGLPSNNYTTQQYQQFSLLSYEASMPIVLVKGKFNGYISPAFVSAQNVITPQGSPDLSGNSHNLFYVSAGIGVRL